METGDSLDIKGFLALPSNRHPSFFIKFCMYFGPIRKTKSGFDANLHRHQENYMSLVFFVDLYHKNTLL